MNARGIDVSSYQPAIDWAKVAAQGFAFAFVKCSENIAWDSHYRVHAERARAAGLLVGAYHFFRPAHDPVVQATTAVHAAQALIHGPDLPLVVDVETWDAVASADVLDRVLKWIDAVGVATGRKPILYTSPSFWAKIPKVPTAAAMPCDLWIAHWGVASPDVPHPSWDRWTFWQTSAKGKVDGIPGDVDTDEFGGDVDALRAYAHGTSPRADTVPAPENVTDNPGDAVGETGQGNRGET